MSAKGTTWSNHKYIKVENGKYFYPDSYEGGRHAETNEQTVESKEPTGWDSKLFSSFESQLKGVNGKLDPKAVQNMLLFGKDENGKAYDNFRVALEKAGINTKDIDDNSLNLMRYKVVEHYKKEFSKEKGENKSEEKTTKSAKSGSSKSSGGGKSSGGSSKKESAGKGESKKEESGSDIIKKKNATAKKQTKYAYKANKKVQYVTAKPKLIHGLMDPVYVIRPTGLKWNIL